MSANSDFANYIAEMRTIASHLEAARKVAIGIYACNPDSRNVEAFEDLPERIFDIEEEVEKAGADAVKKFKVHLRRASND